MKEDAKSRRRAYMIEWRKANREQLKLNAKKYYHANKEKLLASGKVRYQQSRDKKLQYAKERYALNRSRILEMQRIRDFNKRDELRQRQHEWRENNRDKLRAYARARYAADPKKNIAQSRVWRAANRERDNERRRISKIKRRKSDINFRLRESLRARISAAMKLNSKKSAGTEILLGCTIPFLREYLSARFANGMTWENYGTWHVDHIIPCASFDLRDPNQQRRCFHYSNLQPLWAKENLRKRACIPTAHQSHLL